MNIKSSTMYMQMLCLGLSIDTPPNHHTYFMYRSIFISLLIELLVSDTCTLIISLHVSISIYVTPAHTLSTNVFLTHNLDVPSMTNPPSLSRHIRCLCKTP